MASDWTRLPAGRAAKGPLSEKIKLCARKKELRALSGAAAPPGGQKTAFSAGLHRSSGKIQALGKRKGPPGKKFSLLVKKCLVARYERGKRNLGPLL